MRFMIDNRHSIKTTTLSMHVICFHFIIFHLYYFYYFQMTDMIDLEVYPVYDRLRHSIKTPPPHTYQISEN